MKSLPGEPAAQALDLPTALCLDLAVSISTVLGAAEARVKTSEMQPLPARGGSEHLGDTIHTGGEELHGLPKKLENQMGIQFCLE